MTGKNPLKYLIALQLTPHVGPKTARQLIAFCGSVENVFLEKFSHLVAIPDVGELRARAIANFSDFDRVDKELEFIQKNNITATSFLDEKYPLRLKEIDTAPLVLFSKGNADLNHLRIIGIVGTRRATEYGHEMCEKLVAQLAAYDVLVVSGLAYGIDQYAHQASVDNHIPTVAVLGHGLDQIYPYRNKGLAAKMIENGGLVTEFLSETKLSPENFPKRNRIVAGLVDGLVIVETAKRGGALITAEIAWSYNRSLFAVPGKLGDLYSEGCNNLVRIQKANLIHSADDIAYHLGWEKSKTGHTKPKTPSLSSLDEEERLIVKTIKSKGKLHIDKLATINSFSTSDLSVKLLNLEFKGFVKAYPGNFYKTTF